MPDFLLNESTAARRRVFFTAVKSDDVNDRLIASEMSTFTLSLSKNGGTPATPSGTTVTEVSSGSQPGVWYVALNAADLDTLGDSVLVITNAGGTKAMRPREIRLRVLAADPYAATPPVDVTKWNGTVVATPTTAGVPRVDVKAMEANVLTATAINADAITAAKIADGAIDLATFAADALSGAFGIVASGTATAGSTTTMTLAVGSSAVDGAYADGVVLIRSGTGALQVNQIDSYVGATRVATMKRTFSTAVGATSVYAIYAGGSSSAAPSAAANAAAVWSYVLVTLGSVQAGDLHRLLLAVIAGPVTDFTSGTLIWKCPFSGKTRLTASVDTTGRIAGSFVIGDLTD